MYDKYLQYIKNTGGSPKIEHFDSDWEPIGPQVRADMEHAGLIYERDGHLCMTETDSKQAELLMSMDGLSSRSLFFLDQLGDDPSITAGQSAELDEHFEEMGAAERTLFWKHFKAESPKLAKRWSNKSSTAKALHIG